MVIWLRGTAVSQPSFLWSATRWFLAFLVCGIFLPAMGRWRWTASRQLTRAAPACLHDASLLPASFPHWTKLQVVMHCWQASSSPPLSCNTSRIRGEEFGPTWPWGEFFSLGKYVVSSNIPHPISFSGFPTFLSLFSFSCPQHCFVHDFFLYFRPFFPTHCSLLTSYRYLIGFFTLNHWQIVLNVAHASTHLYQAFESNFDDKHVCFVAFSLSQVWPSFTSVVQSHPPLCRKISIIIPYDATILADPDNKAAYRGYSQTF